ncbi:hypothetical protein ACH5RR_006477 [Cinchona calisaya]|uniref:Uncharacterized protein n=1 Tax=Cinchona calisaya TaxID=153742 RepID=A0ABD3APF1_9GENT
MTTMVRVGIFAMLCILTTPQYLQVADADESPIKNLCSNTHELGYCKCYFQPIIGSNQQDARGLGGSSIKCAAKQYIVVQLDYRELASNCTDDYVKGHSLAINFGFNPMPQVENPSSDAAIHVSNPQFWADLVHAHGSSHEGMALSYQPPISVPNDEVVVTIDMLGVSEGIRKWRNAIIGSEYST